MVPVGRINAQGCGMYVRNLKGCWRILKTPIRLRGVAKTDMIWKTCCALHNWLLEIDGLDTEWESGVRTDWEGSLGNFAIQRLHAATNLPNQAWDQSDMGFGSDYNPEEDIGGTNIEDDSGDVGLTEVSQTEVNIVRNLSHSTFQSKLIRHFDHCFKKNELIWPKRKPN